MFGVGIFSNSMIFLYITELIVQVSPLYVSVDNTLLYIRERYKLYFKLKLICLLFHMMYIRIIAGVTRDNLILISVSQDPYFDRVAPR